MLLIIIAFIIGIATSAFMAETIDVDVAIPLCVLCVALISTIANRKRDIAFTLSVSAFFFAVGYTHHSINYEDTDAYYVHKSIKANPLQDKLHAVYVERIAKEDCGLSLIKNDTTHTADVPISDELAVIEAITIGRKVDLRREVKRAFSQSGVSHVLALSGFHVSFIYVILCFLFFQKFSPLRIRLLTSIVIIAILWLYAYVAGMTPSIVRAVLMFSIYTLARNLALEAPPLNTCAMAALAILIFDPNSIADIGFQLSFISVLGIILLKPTNIITVSLVCNLFSMPLVAYYFHSIPLLSILTNILITLFVPLLLLSSAAWWATLWLLPINSLITSVVVWSAHAMLWIAQNVASIPYSAFICYPDIWDIIILYAALAFAVYYHHSLKRRILPHALFSISGKIVPISTPSYLPLVIALCLFILVCWRSIFEALLA